MMIRVFLPAAFASSCAVVLAAGCTSGSSQANGAGSDGPTTDSATSGDGSAPGATSELSCLGVVQCVGNCPDDANASTCADGCLAQTRPSSQTLTNGFATCIETNECADADCIRTKCANELDACVADDAKDQEGTPPTAVSGSLPTDLVGIWASIGTSIGTSYEFSADGTTIQTFSTDNSLAGCKSGIEVSSNGVTTGTADTIVYHRKNGNQVITTCGNRKGSALEPRDLTYRYALGTSESGFPELTLNLVNEDGSLSSSPIVLRRSQ